ncbi:MAG TPA: carboxypeptidase-like regulatory domain-containing protein, partial [Chitinophagaceae bacterium]
MRTLLHSFRLKRLSCALLALTVLGTYNVQAQTGYATASGKKKGIFGMFSQDEQQNQPAANKNTLFNVLKDLNKQKGVYFLFSDASLGSRPVNAVTNHNVDIEKILEQVLKNTGLKYKKVSDNAFVILLIKENPKKVTNPDQVNFDEEQSDLPVAGQGFMGVNALVSGKVTNSDGVPIVGVSITVKGTRRGTSTNTNGEFSIEANKG